MKIILFAPLLASLSAPALAAVADWHTSGSFVLTQQATNESYIRNETEASADVIFQHHTDASDWIVHFEASSSPDIMGVSDLLPEANADVGSALDRDNKGRVQLSELYSQHALNPAQIISVGYLDVSGFFEQSRIASDSVTQFLGASFNGNPTIEFPDYTLGLVYEYVLDTGPVLKASIAKSYGLADNPERSYSQLLTTDDDNNGVFSIASASWKTNTWLLRAGAWINTADHVSIDGNGSGNNNYGAYLLAGFKQGQHALNFRLGKANDKVSSASVFSSLAYMFQQGSYTLGAGAARIVLSSRETNPTLGDTDHFETYLRYQLSRDVFFTGDVQRIVNSNFGLLSENRGHPVTVYGLRLTWLYE